NRFSESVTVALTITRSTSIFRDCCCCANTAAATERPITTTKNPVLGFMGANNHTTAITGFQAGLLLGDLLKLTPRAEFRRVGLKQKGPPSRWREAMGFCQRNWPGKSRSGSSAEAA